MTEAAKKLTEFLVKADNTSLDKMRMDFTVTPPLLIFEDGERFVALDPATDRFYIDPNYMFAYEFAFSVDPSIQDKVGNWGNVLLEKARESHLDRWLANINL